MNVKRSLYGPDDPRGPTIGADVAIVKWGLNHVETNFFPRPAGGFDDVYNVRTVQAVQTLQRLNHIEATGHLGQATFDVVWEYLDAYRRWKYRVFQVPKPPPVPVVLVEPVQGFGSLHKELWTDYSAGRRMGLTDVGTYNPASRLPSGTPSDHAVYPAWAFDLGFSPATGFDQPVAHAFFQSMVGRPEIHYVILGDRIWSREKGLHGYTGGGHESHVHTSGLH